MHTLAVKQSDGDVPGTDSDPIISSIKTDENFLNRLSRENRRDYPTVVATPHTTTALTDGAPMYESFIDHYHL